MVIGCLGAAGWYLTRNNVENAEVGDCIIVTSDTDFSITPCSAAEAEFKVLSVEDGSTGTCNAPDVDTYVYFTGAAAKSWCLQLIVREGDCVSSTIDRIDCATATSSDFKALKVLTNTQSDDGCPQETTLARKYIADKLVACFGPGK